MRVTRWLMILALGLFAALPIVADDSVAEAEAVAKIKQLGGTIHDDVPMGLAFNYEPDESESLLVIPFWSIVIPLVLISGYLLLTKPRSANQKG
ncbi:MAG: hypothetical protein V4719_32105 [Planctomycetota bacterium]